MLEVEALELASGKVGQFARIGEAAFLGSVFRKLGSNNVDFTAGFQSHIFFVGMKCNGHRCGQRPRSRCPDNGVEFFAGERGVELCRIVEQGVLYPDGAAGVILVFDFGFGERVSSCMHQ